MWVVTLEGMRGFSVDAFVKWLSWYRGTSPTRNGTPLGPYSRTTPRALWRDCFL